MAKVPPPPATSDKPLRALIFDSYYDPYRGVIVMFKVMDGSVSQGDTVRFMNTKCEYQIDTLGVLAPTQLQVDTLFAGEVGWLSGSIKQVADARVGDTITLKKAPAKEPYPGYQESKPMVFCGLFPVEQNQVRRCPVAPPPPSPSQWPPPACGAQSLGPSVPVSVPAAGAPAPLTRRPAPVASRSTPTFARRWRSCS